MIKENQTDKILCNQRELADYKHKLKMKELKFQRQSDLMRYNQLFNLEKQKHDWKLEEQRIYFAEQKKHQIAKENTWRYRRQ